jgi:AraC-like DNA-binding protein
MQTKPLQNIPLWQEDYTKPPFYTPSLPFLLSRHTRQPGDMFSHTHIGFEAAIVLSGEGKILNGDSYFDVKAGDCYFFDCMIPHGMGSDVPMEIILAHTRTASLLSVYPMHGDLRILHPFFALRRGVSPVIQRADSIRHLLTNAEEYSKRKKANWELLTWIQIVAAFAEISQYDSVSLHVTDEVELENLLVVQKAIDYMHHNLLEKITLKEIARHCNFSVSRFSHIFSESMHVSPIRYWNQLRIHYAAERILQTDDKLTTIAFDFGFSSFSQFYTLFKKTFGYSPSYLRKDRKKT